MEEVKGREQVDDLTFLHEAEQRQLLQVGQVGWGGGRGREDGDDLTSAQQKPNRNCHNESLV
jgi:hypothetical protein